MSKPATVLEWRVHLARRQPRRAIIVALVVLATAVICQLAFDNPLFAIVAALLVIFSTADFVLPIHYRITEAGIQMRAGLSLRRMAWSQVRACYRDDCGVKLSPLARPSRLEAFRGIYLWFGDDNADSVMQAIESHRPARAESSG
jgi:hypothetical protein